MDIRGTSVFLQRKIKESRRPNGEGPLSAKSRHWLTVNVTSKPPHPGASRAYLEDVTAAEFCEEGGHGTLRIIPKAVEQCSKLGPLKLGLAPGVGGEIG